MLDPPPPPPHEIAENASMIRHRILAAVRSLRRNARAPVPNKKQRAREKPPAVGETRLAERAAVVATLTVIWIGVLLTVTCVGVTVQDAAADAPVHVNVAVPTYPFPPFDTSRVHVAVPPAFTVAELELPERRDMDTDDATLRVEKILMADLPVPPAVCTASRAAY